MNDRVWSVIASRGNHSFQLSDIDAVAEAGRCDGGDVLALLGLLSRPSARLLKIEFRDGSETGAEVSPTEFIRQLTEWKNRSITDEQWQAWASRTKVRWIPALERRRCHE